MVIVQTAEFDWLQNILKIISESIRGMKLELCRNVHNISLYKNYVFVAIAHVLSWLLQLTFP